MSDEKISEPIGVQSSDVLDWTKSLRDRSPSPVRNGRNSTRSRSPSPSRNARKQTPRKEVYSGTVPSAKGVIMSEFPKPRKSRTPNVAQSLKISSGQRPDSATRRSTGNMTSSMSSSKTKKNTSNEDAKGIEAEYIKNLQQQIYFLELETDYLREQAKRATELQPKMSAEAERMLSKLRVMQADMDALQLENSRKSSSVELINKEKVQLSERVREEEEARQRDKRMLMDEVIDVKKSLTKLEAEVSYKDSQLIDARNELDKSATALKNAETKIITLKSQLEQRIEQHKMTQINLDEKRSELLSAETQLKSMEEKYYNSTVNLQDKLTNDLREEIRGLRHKLKEAEMSAEQERHLRTKMSDDGSAIIRENATLHQQVVELSKQLEREKNLRDEIESRHSSGISEMVQVKDREKEAKFELDYVREQLKKEQEKVKQYMEQVSFKDSVTTQHELQLNTARSRVTELSSMHEQLEKDNVQLRKDKSLLVDHVADIQRKLEQKNEEVVNLKSQMLAMEQKIEELERFNTMEISSQTQKWREFENLAESMRTLSHTMASTKGRSPRNTLHDTSRPLQY